MKIGVLTGGSIPSYLAHSFNVMKMANAFSKLGNEVEVVTANSYRTKSLRRKIKNIDSHYGISNKIKTTWLSPSLGSFLTNKTSGDKLFCKKASKYARENNYDFVYCRSYLIPYYTAKMGIPTFVETHTVNYDYPDLKKIYEIGCLQSFKGLITIHEKIKTEHIKRGIPKEKALVLEDGVDFERFDIEDDPVIWRKKLKLDRKKKYAVYCGSLYPDKGIRVILKAAQLISEEDDIVFLLVGGFESDKKYWKEYCKVNGIKNVIFTGFIENEFVPEYLKAADCLLLPYEMEMKHEVMDINTTSPLKLFEYMAAKRVIVATNIPTIEKILKNKENALLALPTVTDFVIKIKECLKMNNSERKVIEEKAYNDVRKMSWTNRCKKILSLI